MATVASNQALIKQYYGLDPSQVKGAVLETYKPANLELYGFSTYDIRDFLFGPGSGKFGLAEAESLQRAQLGLKQTPITELAGLTIRPQDIAGISRNLQHLAEHPKGSHYSGSFNVGRFVDNTVGVITFGSFPNMTSFFSALGEGKFRPDKLQFNVPFSGAMVNRYTHAVTGFYGGQQLDKPTTPIIDSKVGKAIETAAGAIAGIITGAGVARALTVAEPAGAGQPIAIGSTDAGTIAPGLTNSESAFNATLSGLKGGIYSLGTQSIFQSITTVFGKVGTALTQLFTGNIAGAVQTITAPNQPGAPGAPGQVGQSGTAGMLFSGGAGGGGGANFGTTTQSNSTVNFLMFGIIGVIVLYVLYKVLKK